MNNLRGYILMLRHSHFDVGWPQIDYNLARNNEYDYSKAQKELGYAIASLADEHNGYLAGINVLCDGGSTRGQKEFKKRKSFKPAYCLS